MDTSPSTEPPPAPMALSEESAEPVVVAQESAGAGGPSGTNRDGMLSVLRHKHYRTIWFAAFGSYVGNWFEFVAVRWIVSQETKSEAWMGYLAAAQLCPTLLFGMLGGLVADSVNRRKLLIVTQICMMIIALCMAAVAGFYHGTSPSKSELFLVLALFQGVTVAFNTPAWQVLTPRLVPKAELTQAITLNGISFNMARVVGPAVAGGIMKAFQSPKAKIVETGAAIVVAQSLVSATGGGVSSGDASRGASALLFFNAATFIVVMAAVLTTPDAPAPPEMRGIWRRPGEAIAHAKDAFRWVWHRKGPRALFLATVLFAVFATPIMQLMPLMVSEVYRAQEDTYGMLLAIMGCGAVAGGLAMKFLPKWYPMHHFIPLCIAVSGILIFGFAVMGTAVWGMFLMFCIGILWMWTWNSMAAAMQQLVSDHMRGRVSAVMNTIAMGLMPLGTFLASSIGHGGDAILTRLASPDLVNSGTGTQIGLAFVALVLLVAGLVMLTWRTPEVDGLEPGNPGFDSVPGLWRGLTAEFHRRRADVVCPKCFYSLKRDGTMPVAAEDGKVLCPECGERTPIELLSGTGRVVRPDGEGPSGHV